MLLQNIQKENKILQSKIFIFYSILAFTVGLGGGLELIITSDRNVKTTVVNTTPQTIGIITPTSRIGKYS